MVNTLKRIMPALVLFFLLTVLILFSIDRTLDSEGVSIGVMAPLTGNAAELGQHIQRGVLLANEDLQYNLIFEDDQCTNTKAAISAAQKFINIDKVKLVIGPLCAPAYQSVSELFNQNEIGFMHTSGVTEPFIESAGDFGIAGLTTTIKDEDKFLAEFIFNEMKIARMGVFVWNQEWALEHHNGFVERFSELGGEIVFDETFLISDNNFQTSFLKLKDSGAQGIFIVGLNFQKAEIVKQLRRMDDEITIFGQFEIQDKAFINSAGIDAEGIYYVHPKINQSDARTQVFISSFEKEYGEKPLYYDFIAYDSLYLYHWAITQCGATNSKCIISSIKNSGYQGVSGNFDFEDGYLGREFEIKQIKGGKFISYS